MGLGGACRGAAVGGRGLEEGAATTPRPAALGGRSHPGAGDGRHGHRQVGPALPPPRPFTPLGLLFAPVTFHPVTFHPAPRLGTPSEVAEVVTFLCSPAAAYVVGETVVVAGGAPSRL